MTSSQIRQSFLDFFQSKQHTIVPSSSLMPDAPNLLFTNAGMNQFVPVFLGQQKADVSKWPGAIPALDTRAADTQKCIRAGGKHNDLEDVGLDTYHHTFFEMLGNWSFGDYFKKEAIEWAWELVTEVWKFPRNRLYVTVYKPGKGEPAEFDQEAYDHWARLFTAAGLDVRLHICSGGKKDNFWMMGDTGPCGPCSELHVDLTPEGNTHGALVNKGDARCIEIWNLVFIQFNANPDGAFSPLPAQHVDTGMGFERVTSIMQGTKGFKDFAHAKISNYETDIFRPIFDELERLSGKKYGSTLPTDMGSTGDSPVPVGGAPTETGKTSASPSGAGLQKDAPSHSAGLVAQRDGQVARATQEQIQSDIAFRVIADHIRTLSFAMADGIQPGNTDRNYVLRRILRRAVRYGRTLGFHEPFFYKLVDVLADTMGDVFPEIRARKKHVQEVIQREEEAFNKTLDRGIEQFDLHFFRTVAAQVERHHKPNSYRYDVRYKGFSSEFVSPDPLPFHKIDLEADYITKLKELGVSVPAFPGGSAFELYDTYGFPLDLTELMARERGLTVDVEGFNKLMDEQRARARAAQKKEVISLSQIETTTPTQFIGYDKLETPARVLEVVSLKDKTAVILDISACYAEMGGQVGDTGALEHGSHLWRIVNTQKSGNTWLHFLASEISNLESQIGDARAVGSGEHTRPRVSQSAPSPTASPRAEVAVGGAPTAAREGACAPQTAPEAGALPLPGSSVTLSVDAPRRHAIERHHTVTHLFHWALHEVVSRDAAQKGSYVGPDKLTFDFNSAPLTAQQVADIEKLVNERILENAGVTWREVPYADVKSRKDVMQFFGDKYGDTVRVVQIGGRPQTLDGYSMELCSGTHTRATGEIGLFRIVAESAIAAGVRRIEAVAGLEAYRKANEELQLIKTLSGKVNSPIGELEKKIESLLAQQKELEKQLRAAQQKEAANTARSLLTKAQATATQTAAAQPQLRAIIENLGVADGDYLQAVADGLKGQFKGVVVLGGVASNAVALVATVAPEFTSRIQAGKILQTIAPIVGGKGGGRPDNARGGGKEVSKLDAALARARELL